MTFTVARIICWIFGHDWSRTLKVFPCGCQDYDYVCCRCRMEVARPAMRLWFCKNQKHSMEDIGLDQESRQLI